MGLCDKIRRARTRRSNTQMDLLKLYGIFCVVYAHCFTHGFSGLGVVSSVYVIQIFMFCSGYFYRRETDSVGAAAYLKKCAKSYLLPYFGWNLAYGLLHEALYRLGVLKFGSGLSLYTLLVQPWLDGEQFGLNLPSWFLLTLFLVAVITWLVRHLLSRVTAMTGTVDAVLLGVLLAVGLAAVALAGPSEDHGLRAAVLRPLVLLPYYQLGIVYRTWNPGPRGHAVLLLGAAAVLAAIWRFGGNIGTKMLYCSFTGNPVLLVLAAVAAVLLTASICGLAAPALSGVRLVRYGGRCTMYIMLHHMLVLYGIQGLWYLIGAAGFASQRFQTSLWYRFCFQRPWLLWVYLLAALAVPMAAHYVYETLVLRLGNGRDA